jgi:hypothetical protein
VAACYRGCGAGNKRDFAAADQYNARFPDFLIQVGLPDRSAEVVMLILRGASALSSFRCDKLLARLREVAAVKSVYAEYVHFADLATELTPRQTSVLELLLHYGPRQVELV